MEVTARAQGSRPFYKINLFKYRYSIFFFNNSTVFTSVK